MSVNSDRSLKEAAAPPPSAVDAATARLASAAAPILSVNNIEVVYDHVILVLKGVSLAVPKGEIVALLGVQRRRQVDHAQGDFQPARPPSAAK